LVHCRSEREAEALRAELQARLAECHLELHPTKTKIVYCKDGKRKATYKSDCAADGRVPATNRHELAELSLP
jgi:retron-type reverse transcriptase